VIDIHSVTRSSAIAEVSLAATQLCEKMLFYAWQCQRRLWVCECMFVGRHIRSSSRPAIISHEQLEHFLINLTGNIHWPLLMTWLYSGGQGHRRPSRSNHVVKVIYLFRYVVAYASTL